MPFSEEEIKNTHFPISEAIVVNRHSIWHPTATCYIDIIDEKFC